MALVSVGSLGTGVSKTAGTTVVITTGATAEVGNLIIVAIAANNIQTTDGDSTDINSVTDSAGNSYTIVKQYTNGNGVAQDGATAGLAYAVVTTELASGGTITVNVDSVVSKCASAWEFTRDTAQTIGVADSTGDVGDAADPAPVTLSGLTSRQYLFVNAHAGEAEEAGVDTTYTEDSGAGFTALTKTTTTGGAAPTNMFVAGGFKIVTATSQVYDASTTVDVDYAQVYAALYEAAAQSQAPRSMHQYRQRRI